MGVPPRVSRAMRYRHSGSSGGDGAPPLRPPIRTGPPGGSWATRRASVGPALHHARRTSAEPLVFSAPSAAARRAWHKPGRLLPYEGLHCERLEQEGLQKSAGSTRDRKWGSNADMQAALNVRAARARGQYYGWFRSRGIDARAPSPRCPARPCVGGAAAPRLSPARWPRCVLRYLLTSSSSSSSSSSAAGPTPAELPPVCAGCARQPSAEDGRRGGGRGAHEAHARCRGRRRHRSQEALRAVQDLHEHDGGERGELQDLHEHGGGERGNCKTCVNMVAVRGRSACPLELRKRGQGTGGIHGLALAATGGSAAPDCQGLPGSCPCAGRAAPRRTGPLPPGRAPLSCCRPGFPVAPRRASASSSASRSACGRRRWQGTRARRCDAPRRAFLRCTARSGLI